jgi:hypothetical protein
MKIFRSIDSLSLAFETFSNIAISSMEALALSQLLSIFLLLLAFVAPVKGKIVEDHLVKSEVISH